MLAGAGLAHRQLEVRRQAEFPAGSAAQGDACVAVPAATLRVTGSSTFTPDVLVPSSNAVLRVRAPTAGRKLYGLIGLGGGALLLLIGLKSFGSRDNTPAIVMTSLGGAGGVAPATGGFSLATGITF